MFRPLPLRFVFAFAVPLVQASALAQPTAPPSVSAEVVVTAEAAPAPAGDLGAAVTVLGRGEIERSHATSLLELLRTVPGLDLVQSGGPGKVASLFLRGAGSNQTLVLVDGVKLNSPYFGGADLSTLATANVERVEVVRGPFSALWGSEAVGGVVQVFTRLATDPGSSVRGSFAAGNAGTREGNLTARATEGIFGVTAGFRRTTTEGELPNDSFAATNVSAAVQADLPDTLRVGLVVRRDESTSGIPFSGAVPTPRRTTTLETTSLSLPLSVSLGEATALEAAAFLARDRPSYADPDDPYGFTSSRTDARRAGARTTLTHAAGAHRLSVGADWERTLVDNEDSYGVELDGVSQRTWSLFLEDRISLAGGRLAVTAGVRRDENSAFGAATSPRLLVSFRVSDRLRLRVAAGTAFRSPTSGELYYPFSGNPGLQPERSASFEAGAEWRLLPELFVETSVFSSEVRDLIQYDFATFTNENVGRARTRGVEVVLQGTLPGGFTARASYTFLDAEDRDTSLPLLRRPRHRASATAGGSLGEGITADVTALWVGRRDDVDPVTYARVASPSYLRLDLAAEGPRLLSRIAPFVRVTNLLGRAYAEAAGFPAPGRRFLLGLDVAF